MPMNVVDQYFTIAEFLAQNGYGVLCSLREFANSHGNGRHRTITYVCARGHVKRMRAKSFINRMKLYRHTPERFCLKCAPARNYSGLRQFGRILEALDDIGFVLLSDPHEFARSHASSQSRRVRFACANDHEDTICARALNDRLRKNKDSPQDVCNICAAQCT